MLEALSYRVVEHAVGAVHGISSLWVGQRMLKNLALSSATASTGEAYKSICAPVSEAGDSHWQSYTGKHRRIPSVCRSQLRLRLLPKPISLRSPRLRTLDEVVRPLLHWIGRQTKE